MCSLWWLKNWPVPVGRGGGYLLHIIYILDYDDDNDNDDVVVVAIRKPDGCVMDLPPAPTLPILVYKIPCHLAKHHHHHHHHLQQSGLVVKKIIIKLSSMVDSNGGQVLDKYKCKIKRMDDNHSSNYPTILSVCLSNVYQMFNTCLLLLLLLLLQLGRYNR